MDTDSICLAADEIRKLAVRAFTRAGVGDGDAHETVDILMTGEMMGIPTHGVIRVPEYIRRIGLGGINVAPHIRVDRRAPALAVVDADNALGPVAGMRGLRAALEMAQETGIAYAGIAESNHFGPLAPYALQACARRMALIVGSNATTTMPPWGGAEARIGNNPLCIALPNPDGAHFILDMAMSVAARGKIRRALREGTTIPEGWAVTRDGGPTTDPAEALEGFLLPMGGHKGSGLSQAVDLLAGLLPGGAFLTGISSWMENPGAPQRIGHFFIAVDAARLHGPGYDGAVREFLQLITSTPPADPAQPVLYPGQREQQLLAAALRDGVSLPAALLAEITQLSQ
ncbi:MAG: Ldh family oxidoreductase [Alphaproteobacteria bacterium]|nr:Ldh family oxidoreductase [Alphaproteobacteria bacterium]